MGDQPGAANSSPKANPVTVGIGASSGGLDAFAELLGSLGDNPGIAVVFVQHPGLNTKSDFIERVAANTSLPVVEIAEGMVPTANTIYQCPPGTMLEIHEGEFRFFDSAPEQQDAPPIDHFFHSLGESHGDRAVGVILSGAGTDGTLGLKAISDYGGLTFAQEPTTAEYDSMPRSAATTGVSDHVLPPGEIAKELVQYVRYLDREALNLAGRQQIDTIETAIPDIAERLMAITGHNFQHYKTNTLGRRIQRRMQVLKISKVEDYVERLQDEEDECHNLFRELLIGVTAFFRDPEAFERLAEEVLPKIFANRQEDDPVRIWVPGCATGEEAFTIAMLCYEFFEGTNRQSDRDGMNHSGDDVFTNSSVPAVQIFASDIDERALTTARKGVFPLGIAENVSPQRLERFFVKKGMRYHIAKEVRELVLFSSHNLISDPPFSRLDLISCRNLLIYLGPHLQKKLIPLFHFALRPKGFLFLGPSENISSHAELFRPIDEKFRISQRKVTAIARSAPLTQPSRPIGLRSSPDTSTPDEDHSDVVQIMQRIILDEFAPKCVVVDENGKILCSSAGTEKYLSIGEGTYENNVLKMAHQGLRIGLRAALSEAREKRRRITHENLSVETLDGKQRVMLTVQPMMRLGEDNGLFIVVFHDVGLPLDVSVNQPDSDVADMARGRLDRAADAMIEQLERELAATREDLEKTMQEMESANEELKSSNEELLSMNEELQSANEELESSKEEIRSSVDAVARSHADMENLLRSTQIATVFLDEQRLIRSYTPAITDIYGLLSTDIGRPLEQFVPLVEKMPPLPDFASLVKDEVVEHTVRAKSGASYIRRVLPYRSHDGADAGMVVTFMDVTEIVERESMLTSLMSSTAEGIYGIDCDGICTFANTACARLLGYDGPDELLGKQMHDLVHHHRSDDSIYPNHDCQIYKAYRSGNEIHVDDEVFWRRDGSSFAVEYWSHPQLQDGEIIGCVVTFLDITERRREEVHLGFLADFQSRLIAITKAHELMAMTTQAVRDHFNLARCVFLEFDATGEHVDVLHDENNGDWESLVGRLAVRDFLDDADRKAIMAGRQVVVGDTQLKEGALPDNFRAVEIRSFCTSIYVTDAGAKFGISALRTQAWEWQPYELRLLQEIADRVGIRVERARAEEELANREAHLRRVINNQLGLVGVIGRDGILLEVDDRSISIAGLTRDDVIGKHFADCAWWTYDDHVADQIRDAMERAFKGEVVRYDVPLYAAGLGGEAQRLMIDFMLAPVFDDAGEVEYLIPSGVDISQRKATEEALRESEAQLRIGVQVANFGLAQIEYSNDTIHLTNEAALLYGFGEKAVSLPRSAVHDTFHPEDRAEIQKLIDQCVSNQQEGMISCQHRVIHPDGSIRWLDIRKQVIFDYSVNPPQPRNGILAARDVTQRRQFEQSLQEARAAAEAANESKSAFLANMSHEIRTPMTAIIGYAELLDSLVKDPEARGHLQTIRRNGDFLLGIINDILDLSKIEANKLDIDSGQFSPAGLVEDVRSVMDVRATESGLELKVDYNGEIPAVIESDPKRLKQILINLVGNAVKFTRDGEVRIIVQYEDDKLRFDIVDSGIGMTPEQQERLFQPFTQGDHTVNREFGGTGLGLAISQRLAVMLGGEISVDSEKDKGSTFSVSIAVGDVDDVEFIQPKLTTEPDPKAASTDHIKLDCHVLVVDDQRDIRFLSRKFLSDAGAEVSDAEDGEIAVAAVTESLEQGTPFSLVILDMQMPKLDGYETAVQLRALGYRGPIIALTADAMQGDMSRCIACGCNDYLSKPIDKAALLIMVDNYLRKFRPDTE